MDLLIDDVRDFNVDIIARNGISGLKLLDAFDFEMVYFDHDLGDGITGFEVLSQALNRNRLNQSKIKLITSNPVGRERMENILGDFGFKKIRPNPYESYWEKPYA